MARLTKLAREVRSLRDDWSDEIPEELVTGKGDYKCRVNWFNSVVIILGDAFDHGLIDDKKFARAYNRLETYLGNHINEGHLTTPTDIKKVNTMLDQVLAYCDANK